MPEDWRKALQALGFGRWIADQLSDPPIALQPPGAPKEEPMTEMHVVREGDPTPDPPPGIPDTHTRVVVGDLHGNHVALKALLARVGALAGNGERRSGFHVVHVGDIINGVAESRDDDDKILFLAGYFDVMIPGNHDLHWLYQHPAGLFGGLDPLMPLQHQPQRERLLASGRSMVATAVDGWLITHAGLHRAYYCGRPDLRAEDLAEQLRRAWTEAPGGDVFTAVGPFRSQGNDARPGGVFWQDWRELTALPSLVPQIVGHTPIAEGPVLLRSSDPAGPCPLWNVDVGAKAGRGVAALVKRGRDADWEAVRVG